MIFKAFDTHFNLLLSDVEEEQIVKVEDPNTHLVLNKVHKLSRFEF
jgi:small nuclear ribonucleoprotein (snRNP)-like protein